jgi:hypothetical protein
MKYVSPIYEVEAIETEDIMNESPLALANKYGIIVSGKKKEDAVTSVTLTYTDTSNPNAQPGEPSEGQVPNGVSIGINFGSLFGNN